MPERRRLRLECGYALSVIVVLPLLVLCSGCHGSNDAATTSTVRPSPSTTTKTDFGGEPLVVIPRRVSKACAAQKLIRPICPGLIPKTPHVAGMTLRVIQAKPSLKNRVCFAEFNLVVGGESPHNPERNRPSHSFFHVALAAGWFGSTSPFPFPQSEVTHRTGEHLRNGEMYDQRDRPISFGQRDWNGISGYLFLAPPEELGGLFGNHLVYYWESRGVNYIFSLHSWEPLTQAVATLHRLLDTIPSQQPPGHTPMGCYPLTP